jgi:hypothetical protein
MPRRFPRALTALLGFVASPSILVAQGAVDPSIAPRAAQLAQSGDRQQATEMLGHYLATAPDDGSAWLELGLFYLADSREWHRGGHSGEPPATLFLDFAATALDQSLRLPTDSGHLVRALVEVDRAASVVEGEGWSAMRASFVVAAGAEPPAYVLEIGRNLVNSCPLGGVLVTGSDLEAVAAWSAMLEDEGRSDLVLVLGSRFAGDSVYRAQMAQVLDLPPENSARAALSQIAAHRPVCLSPAADTSLAPTGTLNVIRMVRVAGPGAPESALPLSVSELLQAYYARPGPVTAEVVKLYLDAARANPALCVSLLAPLGPRARAGCGH